MPMVMLIIILALFRRFLRLLPSSLDYLTSEFSKCSVVGSNENSQNKLECLLLSSFWNTLFHLVTEDSSVATVSEFMGRALCHGHTYR